jgi:glycosyltransferase involved in cell wall biosynthesis
MKMPMEQHPPIRVLRIQSRICIGGPALNTINLSSGLEEKGFHTILVGGRLQENEQSMVPLAVEKGVDVRIIPEMGRSVALFDDLKALFKLIALIRSFQPHIVHTHTAKAGALGRIAAMLCRVPIRFHTFHGHVFTGYFKPWVNSIVIRVERMLGRISSRIIAISRIQFEDLTLKYRIISKNKCRIVPLGFELRKIYGGEPGLFRSSLNVRENTVLCGILARLVPVKDHRFLLDAIREWKNRFREMSTVRPVFLIIGDGDLREELENQTDELGIRDWVVFTGWRQDLKAIYADLDLNILVSRNEGTPVTLIEGMACGVPILAKDVGGIRDIAPQGAGTILPAHCSPVQFAESIQKFLSNPKCLSHEVQAKVRANFDVSRLVSDMEHHYRELLSERGIS